MMNLIEQQNILRGLPDEALPKALETGETPPFLVLSEISRRKTARERYEGNRAKYARNNTSVVEDLIGAKLARPGLMQRAGAVPQTPGGLDAIAPGATDEPPRGLDAAMPAFAGGGYVEDYQSALAERLSAIPEQRDRARALAIIAAGTGMMGGKSSNTLTNIGQGLAAALPVYQRGIDAADTTEMDLLRQQFDVGRTQHQDELEELDRKFREEEAKRDNALRERALLPEDVREALWRAEAPPEVADVYDKLDTDRALKLDKEAEADYSRVYRDISRRYIGSDGNINIGALPSELQTLMMTDPERGRQAVKQLIKQETLSEYLTQFPRHADKALEYQQMLDVDTPSSGGKGALWSDYFSE